MEVRHGKISTAERLHKKAPAPVQSPSPQPHNDGQPPRRNGAEPTKRHLPDALLRKRARLAQIEAVIANPVTTIIDPITGLSRTFRPTPNSQRRLFLEQQEILQEISEIEAERERIARLKTRSTREDPSIPESTAKVVGQPTTSALNVSNSKKKTTEHDLRQAMEKVCHPEKHPTMNAREIAAYLGTALPTVYEHPGLESAATGTRKRLWTTKSVTAIKPLSQ